MALKRRKKKESDDAFRYDAERKQEQKIFERMLTPLGKVGIKKISFGTWKIFKW